MKQRITVTIDSDSYQLLKSADVNISGLVNTAMQKEARRLRTQAGRLYPEFLAPLRQTGGYVLSDRSGRACAGNTR